MFIIELNYYKHWIELKNEILNRDLTKVKQEFIFSGFRSKYLFFLVFSLRRCLT